MPRSEEKDETQKTGKELTPRQGAALALRTLPGVEAILKKFSDTELSIELKMPDDEAIALLVDPDKLVTEAQAFEVRDDETYKLAKAAADSLLNEADAVEAGRTFSTKGLNALKAGWDALWMPGRKCRQNAAGIYHSKMRAYDDAKKAEDKKIREQQAEEARKQKDELARQADEKRKRADKLKSPGKKMEALQEAAALESAAESIPTEYAQTTISTPSLGSGSKSEPWLGEVTDDPEFLMWLVGQKLWIGKILGKYLQSGLNDLAKQVKDTTEIPGFRAFQKTSYRRKAKKKQ
jgi:hypothetical protein